jgi:hypothetical protein
MQFDEIRELKTRKEDFVKILKDLIEWDEQIKTKSPKFLENLKIKKTLAEMPSKKLKITFLKLDEFIFYVVVQYKSLNGEITTSWVHEDEIYKERLLNNKDHLSYKVVCLTDLYEVAEPIHYFYKDVA